MSDRIDVARVELRDGYTIDGKAERWLLAADFAMGYEPDTDLLVVQRRGSSTVHVIPWANIKGIELDRKLPAEQRASRNGSPSPKERDTAAHGPVQALRGEAPAVAEVTGAQPARGAGGGSRRARPPQ